jgi:chemotaxis protein methyltransferase CheR
VKQDDFDFLRIFLKQQSGLVLSADKTYLIESRLIPVARRRGLQGLDDLVAAVRAGRDAALCVEVVEAMTTNESFFFRDIKPFETLREVVLPRVVAARKAEGAQRLRIWSAACSSGQEPYTIAMLLKENPALLQGLAVEIVATDLSQEILDKAKAGTYSQFEAQRGLPIQLLLKYFAQVGEHWQIAAALRAMISFHQANLLQDLSRFGRFDIVFCRNVLIYFDGPTKTDVLNRIRRMMPKDGILYLGGAESVLGITEAFTTLPGERGVYVAAADRAPAPAGQPVLAAKPATPAAATLARTA